jgi:hypothetical protein
VIALGEREREPPRALVRLADGDRCWALAFRGAVRGDVVTVRYARRDRGGQLRDALLVATV